MGKTILVTSAQVNAARLWIERAAGDGTPIPEAIRKLAQARPRPVVREAPMPDGLAEEPSGSRPDEDPRTAAVADLEEVQQQMQRGLEAAKARFLE